MRPAPRSRRWGIAAVVLTGLALAAAGSELRAAPPVPDGPALLARRCGSCHADRPKGGMGGLDLRTRAAALRGGAHGTALVPGQPEASRLFLAVTGKQEPRMPPGSALPPAEVEQLRAWIAAGAPWPDRSGGDTTWWAFRPVPPVVPGSIDQMVRAGLKARGLSPSPPADRATLLRRLSFDLTGLPPTPEELDSFLQDRRPDAYVRQVDRLLASPRYGEHWARHWLDVARYSESQGFERDKIREHAWRYRDYVIQALNSDRSYWQFVRDQVAGDVLPDADAQTMAATGFLVCGPYDEVGQLQPSEVMRRRVREDELEDMVGLVGQTFLGVTLNCARCHNHKYDPITQRDYYRVQAALIGVRAGDRPAETPADGGKRLAQLAEARGRLEAVDRQLAALNQTAADRLAKTQNASPVPPVAPMLRWSFDRTNRDTVRGAMLTLSGGAQLSGGSLVLDGRSGKAELPLDRTVSAKTLEAWVKPSRLDQRGGGVLGLEDSTGTVFDTLVFGELQPKKWMAGSEVHRRSRDPGGAEETVTDRFTHLAITYGADGIISLYRNGELYGTPYPAGSPVKFAAGAARVLLGLRHSVGVTVGDGRWFQGEIDEARVYDRPLTPAEVRASFRAGPTGWSDAQLLAALSPSEREQHAALRMDRERETAAVETLRTTPTTYGVVSSKVGPVRVLGRGDVARPEEPVLPGGVACAGEGASDWGLPEDSPDAVRRLKLAEWLTSPENPLPARVLVNRVWHHHFGRGLVGTPNDLGANGEEPSHPELLNWLAARFRSPQHLNGSLKQLHRLIVLSQTYQQSSVWRPEAGKKDADNRFLWRFSPRRLTAEETRDTLLSVSGQLRHLGGGPGFLPYEVTVANSHFYAYQDRTEPAFQRRSIYRTVVTSGPFPLLEALDCPDATVKTPRRATTLTPIQALTLMNNGFMLRQADLLAARVEEAGDSAVTRMFQLCFGRPATATETGRLLPFVRKHGLPALARAMLNANEFLFVR